MTTRRDVLVGTAALIGFSQIAEAQIQINAEIGSPFPDLRYINPARQWSSVARLPQQTAVIYLWASWCPICEGDLPNIAAVRKRLGGDTAKVTFLLLNFLEPFVVGYNWAKGKGFDLPLSESDSADRNTPIISTSNGAPATFSRHTPQLYIVDARRVVRWRNRGEGNRQEMLFDTLMGLTVS